MQLFDLSFVGCYYDEDDEEIDVLCPFEMKSLFDKVVRRVLFEANI